MNLVPQEHLMRASRLHLTGEFLGAILTLALSATLIACGPATRPPAGQDVPKRGKLRVVATTTLVGDVARAVGGDAMELTVLLPVGADPHTFEPTPRDAATLANAHVIFVNGAGLESFLSRLLANVGDKVRVVSVSDGIELRRFEGEHEGEEVDPHVWFNPLNVVVWTHNIERALSTLDPANASTYAANARQYEATLRELDAWIQDQVAQVPPERRKLVSDHAVFGYFADRYRFEQVGTVIPGFSTVAEASAHELAGLVDTIRELGVPAIFVGTTVNPSLAQRIAEDTGIRLVRLYTGSLSEPGGPADSYLSFMRYDVSAIVDALSPSPSSTAPPSPTDTPAPTATSRPLPSPTPAAFPPAIALEPAFTGFRAPVYLAHVGDESRLFVVEKAGRVHLIEDGVIQPTPFLDITDRVGSSGSEQGLLSVAFPPDTPSGAFYVNYTDQRGDTVVARYRLLEGDSRQADRTSEQIVLHVDQPAPNHNGGQLQFGPDGYLYVGMGDGGQAGDPWGNAQNPGVLLGKMLRLDVTGSHTYAIPPDNPFVGRPDVRPEIWALGLRNPWRFSFDRATGDLYLADVGQNRYEEVDFQSAGSQGGENYGWDVMEGKHCFEPATGCDPSGLVPPVAEYDHSQGCSITGGYVYRGTRYPQLAGVYFFGDYCSGRIWGLRREPDGEWRMALLLETEVSISSFGEDATGELYVVGYNDGTLYHLTAWP